MASRKFKYVGDPNEEKPDIPDEYEYLGLTFLKGRAKAVADDYLAIKLGGKPGSGEGNNHFSEVGGSKEDSAE